MKKIILSNAVDSIDIGDVIELLQNGSRPTIVYKAKSDKPYYAFLGERGSGYAFHAAHGVNQKRYIS